MKNPSSTAANSGLRSFPIPGSAIATIIGDDPGRRTFHNRLNSMNRFVVFFYRIGLLPLLGAGKTLMLLVTKGRKSGQWRSFPVGYLRISGVICLLSGWGKSANWYKNIAVNPNEVLLQIGLRRFQVRAEVLSDRGEIESLLKQLIAESPADAKRLFGWDPQTDRIETSDFAPIIEKVVFLRFYPK